SMSVNVSVVSGKDEFFNAGQLSVSSSARDMLLKLLLRIAMLLLLYVSSLMEFQVL
ncbi:hypothetical protein CRG98_007080, partial [Punica granatum]